jgi:hypothetical protein
MPILVSDRFPAGWGTHSRAVMAPPKATPGPDGSAGYLRGHTARAFNVSGVISVLLSDPIGHSAQRIFAMFSGELQAIVHFAARMLWQLSCISD